MACNQCDLVVESQVSPLELGRSRWPLDRRGRPLRAKVSMAPRTPGRATGNCSINARPQGKVSPSHSAPKAIKASSCAAMFSWSLRFLTGSRRCNVLSIEMIGCQHSCVICIGFYSGTSKIRFKALVTKTKWRIARACEMKKCDSYLGISRLMPVFSATPRACPSRPHTAHSPRSATATPATAARVARQTTLHRCVQTGAQRAGRPCRPGWLVH